MLVLSFLTTLPIVYSQLLVNQAGRVPCGIKIANQTICDLILPDNNINNFPIKSQCVENRAENYFCGFAGASCVQDDQCDYGRCLIGECFGGFEQSCEADNQCNGNLQCTGPLCTINDCSGSQKGTGSCGGLGAGCNYAGNFESSFNPNNQACASSYCNPSSLQCDLPPGPPPLGHIGALNGTL